MFATMLVVVVLACLGTERQRSRDVLRGTTMGTTYTVRLGDRLSVGDRNRVRTLVEAELASVEHLMSTYDPRSEISRFNRFSSTEAFPLSRSTLEVLRLAQEISEKTGGAFDVTAAPLVAAWGFGSTDRIPAPPTYDELAAARQRVGFRMLRVGSNAAVVSKQRADMRVDLSAIAKGYAVDRAVVSLVEAGYRNILVEVGGDLRAAGHRPGGDAWRAAIEQPIAARTEIHRVLSLRDAALATSGDYRSYYESGGRRLSHLIDPRSGRPISNGIAAVSVVHGRAAVADALATALSILGPEKGMEWAEKERIAALFLVRRSEGFEALWTSGFAPLLLREARLEDTSPREYR